MRFVCYIIQAISRIIMSYELTISFITRKYFFFDGKVFISNSINYFYPAYQFMYNGRNKPGVNFINVLMSSFYVCRSQKRKRYWGFDWIITLLGSGHVKAAHKTMIKLPQVRRRELDHKRQAFLMDNFSTECVTNLG